MIVAVAVAAVIGHRGRFRRARLAPPAVEHLVDQASLLELAVGAGMSLHASLRWSQPHLHPVLGRETGTVLRGAAIGGLADGLRSATGPSAGLFRVLARSVETGAAIESTIVAFREQLEATAAAEAAKRLQRLPVKLVVPLALLMLPGLILMAAVPALIDALSRFG